MKFLPELWTTTGTLLLYNIISESSSSPVYPYFYFYEVKIKVYERPKVKHRRRVGASFSRIFFAVKINFYFNSTRDRPLLKRNNVFIRVEFLILVFPSDLVLIIQFFIHCFDSTGWRMKKPSGVEWNSFNEFRKLIIYLSVAK